MQLKQMPWTQARRLRQACSGPRDGEAPTPGRQGIRGALVGPLVKLVFARDSWTQTLGRRAGRTFVAVLTARPTPTMLALLPVAQWETSPALPSCSPDAHPRRLRSPGP